MIEYPSEFTNTSTLQATGCYRGRNCTQVTLFSKLAIRVEWRKKRGLVDQFLSGGDFQSNSKHIGWEVGGREGRGGREAQLQPRTAS